VLCTFELYVNHLTTNILVLCTFLIDLKAAELQNICRNTVEKQNHRCRAPEYLISFGVSFPQLAAKFALCGWYFDTPLLAAGRFISNHKYH
jgi:hypothetical protein